MRFKNLLLIFVVALLCFCEMPVVAAKEGTVRLELPKEMSGEKIYIIGNEEEQEIPVDEEGIAVISNLTASTYQIRIPNTETLTFMQTEVKIPMWSEEEHKMLYDITVIPKYSRKPVAPKTGDNNPLIACMAATMVSIVTMAIVLRCRKCKNRK